MEKELKEKLWKTTKIFLWLFGILFVVTSYQLIKDPYFEGGLGFIFIMMFVLVFLAFVLGVVIDIVAFKFKKQYKKAHS